MAVKMVFLLLLWGISLFSVPCNARQDFVCNETVYLNTTRSAQINSSHPKNLRRPVDCWLELSAPPDQVLSVESTHVNTTDNTCSNWASFVDGNRTAPIKDKVCFSKSVHWTSTGNVATVWYHTEVRSSSLNLYLTAETPTCPKACDEVGTFHLFDNVHLAPYRRSGADCSYHSCMWTACASLPEQTVALRIGRVAEKCLFPQLQIYDTPDKPLTVDGLSCDQTYVSPGQCMLVEYQLNPLSTTRFHASAHGSSVVVHGSAYMVMFCLFVVTLLLGIVFMCLWCFRCQRFHLIRRKVTLYVRRLSIRESGRGQPRARRDAGTSSLREAPSTTEIAVISGVTFDQPPSYSSLCRESALEEGPPAYPDDQLSATVSDCESSVDAVSAPPSPTSTRPDTGSIRSSRTPPVDYDDQKKF